MLAKNVDQYSGDELFTFTHGLTFVGGNERQRRCRGHAECGGMRARRSTRLRIDAVDRQDSLSAATIPANGVVAARILNRGPMPDSVYGMQAGTNHEYYFIIMRGAQAGGATWRVEDLVTTVGVRTHRTVATGRLRECNHPFVRGARADFKSCAQAATGVRPAALRPFPQTEDDAPIWIACALGCCTADPPDGRS